MNLMRAKEIKEDPVMKDVVHNGKYVYIKDVNDETQKALVRYTKRSEEHFEVDVTHLSEE
ncbi:Small acid-soluble spore protein H family protein [Gracilibacillus orientalis]|uniref:Small acid-soluble spore protein H family protein n=1 Tax=Gracilibacillus orientalis TaxID=334253 RepID=A0A1I4JVL5_9BACI|nr:H-type small acid-soluble spore protein [Gracilibacillus orientalis]SFL70570.1 Small acid-soluble spore protein H family protein [Gracilibacillus orientalis]